MKQTLMLIEHQELKVTSSFGIVNAMAKDSNTRSVFHRADEALYVAKQSGRNQVVIAKDD